MTANFDSREMLNQKEIQETTNADYRFIGLTDQNESEIQWVKLHQMFDR